MMLTLHNDESILFVAVSIKNVPVMAHASPNLHAQIISYSTLNLHSLKVVIVILFFQTFISTIYQLITIIHLTI